MLNKILVFLNLLDKDNRLSISNVAVFITLIKLFIAPTASITEAGMLLIALCNYAHKRHVNNGFQQVSSEDLITPQIESLKQQLDDTQSKVSAMALSAGMKTLR